MTRISRLMMTSLLAAASLSPALAQIDTSKLPRAGQNGLTTGGPLVVTRAPAMIVTAQQVAMMPKKVVGGQQLVQSNGKWYSLVASGAGNYQLVASGAGN